MVRNCDRKEHGHFHVYHGFMAKNGKISLDTYFAFLNN